tara:strand:+ start:5159 stop:5524 length:366 start_codon:yes stop_codon:yes gene_type:complete
MRKTYDDWEDFFARIKPGKTPRQLSAITKVNITRMRQLAYEHGYDLQDTPAKVSDNFSPKDTAINRKWDSFFREIPKGLTLFEVAELAGRKSAQYVEARAEKHGYALAPARRRSGYGPFTQ